MGIENNYPFKVVITKDSRESTKVDAKQNTGLNQIMEFLCCFILKFATDHFSNGSFSLLLRISNLPHALKVGAIPGFQELLIIMLLFKVKTGVHHMVIRCLTVSTYLSCLPIFPIDIGPTKLTYFSPGWSCLTFL